MVRTHSPGRTVWSVWFDHATGTETDPLRGYVLHLCTYSSATSHGTQTMGSVERRKYCTADWRAEHNFRDCSCSYILQHYRFRRRRMYARQNLQQGLVTVHRALRTVHITCSSSTVAVILYSCLRRLPDCPLTTMCLFTSLRTPGQTTSLYHHADRNFLPSS